MHKALKRMQERTAKRIEYLFFDRSIEVERIRFSLHWTTLFAQVANQLDEAGYSPDLFSSSSQTYLKFRLKNSHNIQMQLNREYEDEPLLVIQFGPFDPKYDVDVLRPTFSKWASFQAFQRFAGMAYYHPLTGTDEDIVTFITKVAIKLHEAFNN